MGSREEPAVFVRGLSAEFRERGEEWENAALGDFLEAPASCVEDSPGWYPNVGWTMPEGGDRAFFARVLDSATVYE